MPKYIVYGIATASWKIGEYEADSPEEAEIKAMKDKNANYNVSLCYECSRVAEINDIYDIQIEEV